MAVIINKNSIVFEMGTPIEYSLEKIFENAVRKQLPEEKADAVMELLKTCDFYNGGMYENEHFGKLANTTMTYYKKSMKVLVDLEYGNYDLNNPIILGYLDKGILMSATFGMVKEKISYFKSSEGYNVHFTLQFAK